MNSVSEAFLVASHSGRNWIRNALTFDLFEISNPAHQRIAAYLKAGKETAYIFAGHE